MLSVLEKTGRPQASGAATAGSDIYSSMVVNSLAEAISNAGGIGLADVIARSTMAHNPPASTPETPAPLTPTPSVQGAPVSLPDPGAVPSPRPRR
jgi:Rod binding domain-containing protein